MPEHLVSQDFGYIVLDQNTFGLDGVPPPQWNVFPDNLDLSFWVVLFTLPPHKFL